MTKHQSLYIRKFTTVKEREQLCQKKGYNTATAKSLLYLTRKITDKNEDIFKDLLKLAKSNEAKFNKLIK